VTIVNTGRTARRAASRYFVGSVVVVFRPAEALINEKFGKEICEEMC